MESLTERQQSLLEWLQTQNAISIEEIEAHFTVSPATVYRDIRALVSAGLAVKTNRGLKLLQTEVEGRCSFCGGNLNPRMTFIFQLQDGSQKKACCPHCGLMGLGQENVVSALATDFLYGRMINARQAVFLVSSSVSLCCEPSVLCFANEDEACRFQQGFGGEVFSLEQAAAQMRVMMSLH